MQNLPLLPLGGRDTVSERPSTQVKQIKVVIDRENNSEEKHDNS